MSFVCSRFSLTIKNNSCTGLDFLCVRLELLSLLAIIFYQRESVIIFEVSCITFG